MKLLLEDFDTGYAALALVTEGIEAEQQRQILIEVGIKFGQGFLCSPARPLEAFKQSS